MEKLLNFIKNSPTAFHAAKNIANILEDNGFIQLSESDLWNLKPNGKYYITRNSSSVLAFTIPSDINQLSFNITAAHLDSPTFKLKPNFTMDTGKYLKLNTEVYGGPILNTWLDRPLNIAGRVIIKDNGLKTKLISFDKPMAIIPNCSIHYYPELNKGAVLNPQIDLLPLFCDKSIQNIDLYDCIAKKLNIEKEDIVSMDLYLAILDRGTLGGLNQEFLMAPQIDNLECAYATLEAFIQAKNNRSVNVLVEFDNEETGSRTRQGAASTMLKDILERISDSLGITKEEHQIALANSFIISADNAHAYHPNYPNKFDATNTVYMNQGVVIKSAARGSYTTDAMSLAYFKMICDKANVKMQLSTNRSDILGGSTLGAISLSNVSICSLDIGLAQMAMHSAFETAGAFDYIEMVNALTEFYNTHLSIPKDGELKF